MMRPRIQPDCTSRPTGATVSVRSWPRAAAIWWLPVLVALWCVTAIGVGQSEWQVDVLIPDTISVRMPTQEVAFGITHADYPPASFPARYGATLPEGGVLRVEVFSKAGGGWSLLLEIPDLIATAGRGLIPADQVLYRVNEGLWTRGSPLPQVIFTSVGATDDWLALTIEFQLELVGNESPGSFAVTTRLTALSDEQGP